MPQPAQNTLPSAQYPFEVAVPEQPKSDVRYRYDYQIEVPTTNTQTNQLQGLYTHIDRIVEQKPDCKNGAGSCTCHHAPHICPVHAPAAPVSSCSCQYTPNACPLHAANNNDIIAETLNFQVTKPDIRIRNKRGLKDTLETLKSKRHISLSELSDRLNEKILELSSKKEELKKRFLEKRSQKPRFDFSELADKAEMAREKFMNGVRANFDGLSRDRRNADSRVQSDKVEMVADVEAAEQKQVSNEVVFCPTIESLKQSKKLSMHPDVLQFMPEVGENAANTDDQVLRTRKHCRDCGAIVNENLCDTCNGMSKSYHPTQSQYYEYIDGMPVAYIPGIEQHHVAMQSPDAHEQIATPQERIVYDRYGHRYHESNGNLRLLTQPQSMLHPQADDTIVGEANMAALDRILNHNQQFIADTNNHAPGRMIDQPITVIRDGVQFIRDILHNPNPLRGSPDTVDDDDDVGMAHEMRAKKDVTKQKFSVVPIMTDNIDGSLLVKIYPTHQRKQREMKQPAVIESDPDVVNDNNDYNEKNNNDEIVVNANGDDENVPQTQTSTQPDITYADVDVSAQTTTTSVDEKSENKRNYEVLTIGGGEYDNLNDEVDQILRFIYDANIRDQLENVNADAPKRKVIETENSKIFH